MMKSNKKSRSLLGLVPALALALVMGCMATTAFAAATDHASVTTAKDVFGQASDVVALSDDSNLSKYAVTDRSDVVLPTARKNISLSSGTNYKYDWTPSTVGLKLDVNSVDADAPITSSISGGEGSVQVTINKSGYFFMWRIPLPLRAQMSVSATPIDF